MREIFAATVAQAIERDPRVAIVLADISAGMFRRSALDHPGRVINLGIREQAMIDVAGGLALTGMRPIVHSYAPFLIERPFEQIKIGLNHQDVGAILVSIGGSYDAAEEGRTHQAPEDVALIDTLPDWTIRVPGHPDEVRNALEQDVPGEGRVYLRLSGTSNRAALPVRSRLHVVRTGSPPPRRVRPGWWSPWDRCSTGSWRPPPTSTSPSPTPPPFAPSTAKGSAR